MQHNAVTSSSGPQPARRPFSASRPGKEVQVNVKKPARFKIGIVSVKEGRTPKAGRSFWELRYTDPPTGLEAKRRVSGLSRDEIRAMAEHLTAQTIELRNTLDATRRDRAQRGMKFVRWLGVHYPAVKTWDQLKPAMVQAYVVSREQAGLAFDSVRLDVAPIKLAWRYVAENWPDLLRPMPKTIQAPAPRREIECLEAEEVMALLDWMKTNAPDLWPIACLQALVGLRVFEAMALRAQDVNLDAGTVTVADTGHHKPKTRDSYRTIPICNEVAQALRAALARQAVRPASGELFTNCRGNLWVKCAIVSRWCRTLRRVALDLGMPRLAKVPAHRLRASFATMAGRLGVPDRLLKAYLGHSSGDMLGTHYRRIDLSELRSVSGAMNGWRGSHIKGDARKEFGNIANIESIED